MRARRECRADLGPIVLGDGQGACPVPSREQARIACARRAGPFRIPLRRQSRSSSFCQPHWQGQFPPAQGNELALLPMPVVLLLSARPWRYGRGDQAWSRSTHRPFQGGPPALQNLSVKRLESIPKPSRQQSGGPRCQSQPSRSRRSGFRQSGQWCSRGSRRKFWPSRLPLYRWCASIYQMYRKYCQAKFRYSCLGRIENGRFRATCVSSEMLGRCECRKIQTKQRIDLPMASRNTRSKWWGIDG
ncbi:hypothetical protein EDF57_10572 [Novosphingobium sp. PhB55]|nr:hypothetical protein EDF57_10572 [Novosphingobium sp. PhB55]